MSKNNIDKIINLYKDEIDELVKEAWITNMIMGQSSYHVSLPKKKRKSNIFQTIERRRKKNEQVKH